jgi:hypothetical protein
MLTKSVDAKGRVNLGEKFAGKMVIVEEIGETEVIVRLARVIPEREAWLYENEAARSAVAEGLAQAKAGKFAENPPDIAADAELADQMEGEE